MRGFAGLDLTDDATPKQTTILKCRHLLEKHGTSALVRSQFIACIT